MQLMHTIYQTDVRECEHSEVGLMLNVIGHVSASRVPPIEMGPPNFATGGHYCASDAVIDAELTELHGQLTMGITQAQVEIDRRVFACIAAEEGWCSDPVYRAIPLQWLYVAPEHTLQYSTLPDLARFIVPTSDHGLRLFEILMHNAIPCLRKGRAAHNAFDTHADTKSAKRRKIEPFHVSETTACIHVLGALFLGLYPTSNKKPVFAVRKRLLRVIRTLVSMHITRQVRFLSRVPNLLRLAFMEYTVNVTRDYCPCEFTYYNSIKGMSVYYQICSNICDSMRMDMLQDPGKCDAPDAFEAFEAHATLLVERFTRTCKFRVHKEDQNQVQVHRRRIQTWRKEIGSDIKQIAAALNDALALPTTETPGSLRVFMLEDGRDAHHRYGNVIASSVMESIQHNVQCFPLPFNLTVQACEALTRFQANPQKVTECSHVRACLWCMNRSMSSPLTGNLRLDVDKNELSCATCRNGVPIVSINMIGRVLRISGTYYYLCPGCVRIHPWQGTGHEFSGTCMCCTPSNRPTRTPKGARVAQRALPPAEVVTPARERRKTGLMHPIHEGTTAMTTLTTSQTRCNRYTCFVCNRVNASHVVHTLHVPQRRRVSVFLCKKHAVYDHLVPFVYDTATLGKILFNAK